MKVKIFIIGFLTILSLNASGQIKVGLELNAYSAVLKNITNAETRFGYAIVPFEHKPSFGISPTILLRKNLTPKFSIETGLGFVNYNHKIVFDNSSFDYSWMRNGWRPDSILTMALNYIQVPVNVTYGIPIKEDLQVNFTGGLRTKVLFSQSNNYQQIIFEEIGLPANPFRRIILAPNLAIGLQKEFTNGNAVELGIAGSYDATPFTRMAWGFFDKLTSSRTLQTGIILKYFL